MTQTTPSSVDAMREAKPCQKCGGKGFPRQSGDGDVEWLQCCSCGHEGPLRYSLTEAVAAWNATLPSDGVTIPADDGGEAITDAAKRMVAVQGMDWAELDGGDIGYWESLAAVALAAPKAPPVAQAEGVVQQAHDHVKKGDHRMGYLAMCEAYGKLAALHPTDPAAIRNAALEEAARVAEVEAEDISATGNPTIDSWQRGRRAMAELIAAAIRGLVKEVG